MYEAGRPIPVSDPREVRMNMAQAALPPRISTITQAIQQAEDAIARVSTLTEFVGQAADRLYGREPEPPCSASGQANAPTVEGQAYELHNTLADLQARLGVLDRQVDRLVNRI